MTLKIEIAFDLSLGGQGNYFTLDDPVKGELDNATYVLAGADVFVDVTDRVRSLRFSRGRSTLLQRFTSASGQIVLDNRDRAFDPSSAPVLYDDPDVGYDSETTGYDTEGSPYYGAILPRKQVRITDDEVLLVLLQVEKWGLGYTLGGDSVATVALTDGLATLAAATLPADTNTGELTGARIDAVLDAVDWPAGQRNLDAGQAMLDADTVAADTNALQYLQKVETSEPGAVFIGKDARLTFRDRATLQTYTAGIVFGDSGDTIPFTEPFDVDYGTDDMVNRASVAWTGGTATVDDAASQATYGILARSFDALLDDGDDATALAQWIVSQNSQPKVRVTRITINRRALTDAQWALVRGLELGDPAGIEWTPGGVGDRLSQVVTVDQIDHSADRGGTVHSVTLNLSQAQAGFILDDAIFGVLDTSVLAF